VQVHPFKIDQRASKDVRKRLRNAEYNKFLLGLEKKEMDKQKKEE